MTMTDDAALLRRYARENSQDAFAELVRRRIDLVYAVALRKVGGDAHLAEDVAQRVFAEVARKAAVLANHPAFSGWLFRSAHYSATQVVRAEQRRRVRETKAEIMKQLDQDDPTREIDWERLRPLLDDLVNELGDRDRAAVMGRFFEGLPLAEIGRRLGLSDAGAQSRVERAVEKLRAALARRGVTSTSTALGLALANQAGAAAPTGLAASVTSAALSGAVGATAGSGLMIFMSATKAAFGGSMILSAAGALLLVSIGLAVYEVRANHATGREWATARERYTTDTAALVRIEESSRVAEGRLAAAVSRAAGLRAALAKPEPAETGVGAKPAASPHDPRADGQAFLAGLGEEGRKVFFESLRGRFRTAYATVIREAELTPAQVSTLGDRLAQHWLDHLIVTSSDIGPDPEDDELPDEEMRLILGEEAFQRWDLAGRKNPGYEWAQGLTLQIQRDAAAPAFTLAQQRELAESVARHSPDFLAGEAVDLDKVDWAAVAAEVQVRLPDSQWRHAQAWLLRQEVEREFTRQKTNPKP